MSFPFDVITFVTANVTVFLKPDEDRGGGGGANQNSDSTNSALTVHC